MSQQIRKTKQEREQKVAKTQKKIRCSDTYIRYCCFVI